ncbi:zinc-dependent peptidase [Pseudaeromonas sharmana]|uniref:Zinc-dependent peptidase n=1 Tax=Pseudaeromonas sharmana TaxID=328412 RepID=A0ABV8CNW5_9GAMM
MLSRLVTWWQRKSQRVAATRYQADAWRCWRLQVPILRGLSEDEGEHLQHLAWQFLQQKSITCIGVTPRTEQMAAMALQACLPIMQLGLDWYRNFYEIILLPAPVERHDEIPLGAGLVAEETSLHLGEAWEQGPVVLVWPEVLHDGHWDGYHLVIHELAHKLDMLADGIANGMPPERPGVPIARWQSVMESSYAAVCHCHDTGVNCCLDEQACDGLDELFAIASEVFFCQPLALQQQYPALYDLLRGWYQQDPVRRQPSETRHWPRLGGQ